MLHNQLNSALETIAALQKDVELARRRERRAVEDATSARQEMEVVHAELLTTRARAEAMGEKVRVSREARLHTQEMLERRESELNRARGELMSS